MENSSNLSDSWNFLSPKFFKPRRRWFLPIAHSKCWDQGTGPSAASLWPKCIHYLCSNTAFAVRRGYIIMSLSRRNTTSSTLSLQYFTPRSTILCMQWKHSMKGAVGVQVSWIYSTQYSKEYGNTAANVVIEVGIIPCEISGWTVNSDR